MKLRQQLLLQQMESWKDEIIREKDRYIKELEAGKLSQDGKHWLTDVIAIEKPAFGSNNLILSPVGSGKSTFIKEVLMSLIEGIVIMLVSTSYLKESEAPSSDKYRREIADMSYTTNNRKVYGKGKTKRLVMTYSEFGRLLHEEDPEFLSLLKEVKHIYCDEVHSLAEYETYGKSRGLLVAQEYLFKEVSGKKIYYFTATDENIKIFKSKFPNKMGDIVTFDYNNYKDIKKYTQQDVTEFNHVNQLRKILENKRRGDFLEYGYKGLIFSNKIKDMKTIEKMLINIGFNPLVLWSVNNKNYPMTKEQLSAMDELRKTEKIPAPYNFLIINGAMREGWNLKDDKVTFAIMNTTSKTDQIQARGRIRSNIAHLVIKTDKPCEVESNLELEDKYLNKPLTTEMKGELCKSLNIYRSNGKQIKWNATKNLLIELGYKVEDKRIRIEGKLIRVSIITR